MGSHNGTFLFDALEHDDLVQAGRLSNDEHSVLTELAYVLGVTDGPDDSIDGWFDDLEAQGLAESLLTGLGQHELTDEQFEAVIDWHTKQAAYQAMCICLMIDAPAQRAARGRDS